MSNFQQTVGLDLNFNKSCIDRWFNPKIWVHSLRSFWCVMMEEAQCRGIITSEEQIRGAGNRACFSPNPVPATPLTSYPGRAYHELAHYIQCADHEVLDPFYGSEVFTFRQDEQGYFLDADFFKEMEVFVLQAMLEGYKPPSWKELVPFMGVKGFSLGRKEFDTLNYPDLKNEPPENVEFARALMEDFAAKWNGGLSQLHKEVRRKDELFLNNPNLKAELYRLQRR